MMTVPDRRGSPVPTARLIATRIMELRKRRGLMIFLIVMNIGLPALFLFIRVLGHAFWPRTSPPAGGSQIFGVLAAGFLPNFAFIAAATLGCTAGSRDLTEGMFRHLVVTGRSRLALYLARIPAGLAVVVPLVAIGYAITCAVCAFAPPVVVTDNGVNIPPGLSRAASPTWADSHAELVVCNFLASPPGNVDCPSGPGTSSVSSVTPGQAAPAPLEALAVKIAGQDYPGYVSILRSPPASVMIEAGLWIELETTVAFILGLGLASLMGQRTVPVILLFIFQIIRTPFPFRGQHRPSGGPAKLVRRAGRVTPGAIRPADDGRGDAGGNRRRRGSWLGAIARVGHRGRLRHHRLAGGLDDPRRMANGD